MKSKEGLGKENGCIDQIFAILMMLEEYLGKDEKLYVDGRLRERMLVECVKCGNYKR